MHIEKTGKIVFPSTLPLRLVKNKNFCTQAYAKLEELGIQIDEKPDFCKKPQKQVFLDSLLKKKSFILWCGKGGYGASSILDQIPWKKLEQLPQNKILVGFSDISALHSALYTKLGWLGLHAAMPFSKLWTKKKILANKALANLVGTDADSLHSIAVKAIHKTKKNNVKKSLKLFGGCFSVLTQLIGTPYFPKLDRHILFLEDINETPGKLQRYFYQWLQSGVLKGCGAIVFGDFSSTFMKKRKENETINNFAKLSGLNCFRTNYLGHIDNNYPMLIGAETFIKDERLYWRNELTFK